MIKYLASGGAVREYLMYTLLTLPVVILALTLHECAHGWAAKKCGDMTASNLGRLTLNPLKHLDSIGFLCMLFLGIGWAKPVPINSRNFRKPRRDIALTAAAGPLANILLGTFFSLLYVVLGQAIVRFGIAGNFFFVLLMFFFIGADLNFYLAVFNLIPIPPFDGSRIVYIFLPPKWYFGIMKYERYIQIALIVLIYFGIGLGPVNFLSELLLNGITGLFDLIPFFG